MHKSKKAGLPADQLVGALTFMIFFTLLIVLGFAVLSAGKSNEEKKAEDSLENINAEYNLNYFLRLKLEDGKTISDSVGSAYLSNDMSQFRFTSDKFFDDIYGARGLGYDLNIGGKRINSIFFDGSVARAVSQIPLITKDTINVELFAGREKQNAALPIKPLK